MEQNPEIENPEIKNPEIDPHKYSPLIFDKDTKAIQWRKDSLLTSAGAIDYIVAKNWTSHFLQKLTHSGLQT